MIAPHAAHTAGLPSFCEAYPAAHFMCPKGGALRRGESLRDMRPELRFQTVVRGEETIKENAELAGLFGPDIAVEVIADGVMNEIVLFHRPSGALIQADFVYKAASFAETAGIGGPERNYIGPDWFRNGYQALNIDPSPSAILPDNRAFLARQAFFDREAFAASLARILAWDAAIMLGTHTDPIEGREVRDSIFGSWQWLETD